MKHRHSQGVVAMHRNRLLFASVACGLLAAAPLAVSYADWYVGGSIGQSSIDATAGEIEEAFLIDDDFVATGTTLDKTDTGWKAFVGYRFFPIFSLEAGYADLGQATFNTTIVEAPPPNDAMTPFPIEGTATVDGAQVAAVLQVPLAGPFSVLAKAGAFRWEAKFTELITDTGVTRVARTEDKTDALYGVGIQLQFADRLGARLEWERLDNVGEGIGGREGRDVDFFSVGVVFGF
jgi:OmpA-OmpF porin, OOP family